MGAISKAVKKIIPKEIQPILPFAASMFGGPIVGAGLGKLGVGSQFLGSALGKGLTGGITNIAAQALTGGKISPRSAILSGLMSGGGSFLRSPTGLEATKFGQKLAPSTLEALQGVGQVLDPAEITKEGYSLTGTGEGLSPITRPGYAALTVGGAEAAYQTAEEEQRRFEEEQAASEASQQADMASRAEFLRNYAELAGYSEEEINDLLDRYGYSGYQMGGRVGYRIGGGPVKSFIAKLLNAEPSEEVLNKMFEERKKEIFNSMFDPEVPSTNYTMEQMQEADKIATEQAMKELEEYKERIGMEMENPPEDTVGSDVIKQIMEPRKEGRVMEANGGMINMKMGGMPAEMDLRGGGFVPIGAKERADDVPARLSKNEFVMTADAVRAAGGGSVNKGAKRMYDLMNKLEARV